MQSSYEINENIMMFATEYEIHIERTQAHMAMRNISESF